MDASGRDPRANTDSQMAIRVSCLLKKRPEMTLEQFSAYWNGHGNLFTSQKATKDNVIRYNQFRLAPQHSEKLAAAGFPIAPYDGIADVYVDKLEDLFALFADEDVKKNVLPDEANFLDKSQIQAVLVGENNIKWEKPQA
ncbi:unnamed protein product [Somion occarium]|uniref:EthD domain-containing protein n=1 Tax=Somion occarium TaxID=3059160 RepID=A0ABP1DKW2_9APHY